jgi:hypothetical protein
MTDQLNPSHLKPISGQTCPTCGFQNRLGVLLCEKCGTNLKTGRFEAAGTREFDRPRSDERETVVTEHPARSAGPVGGITAAMIDAVMTAGSQVFSTRMLLRLEIEGSSTPVVFQPKAETSLGRRDPATGTMPDVDLTAYAGYRMGVSRKHAIIRHRGEQLEIYDLGSSNGTHLNGQRLVPHQAYVVRDGDTILLGKMSIRALFQIDDRA